jgi:hypothetical protein
LILSISTAAHICWFGQLLWLLNGGGSHVHLGGFPPMVLSPSPGCSQHMVLSEFVAAPQCWFYLPGFGCSSTMVLSTYMAARNHWFTQLIWLLGCCGSLCSYGSGKLTRSRPRWLSQRSGRLLLVVFCA